MMNDVATLINYLKETEDNIRNLEHELNIVNNEHCNKLNNLREKRDLLLELISMVDRIPYSRKEENFRGSVLLNLRAFLSQLDSKIEKENRLYNEFDHIKEVK